MQRIKQFNVYINMMAVGGAGGKNEPNKEYKFWSTQPVPLLDEV